MKTPELSKNCKIKFNEVKNVTKTVTDENGKETEKIVEEDIIPEIKLSG